MKYDIFHSVYEYFVKTAFTFVKNVQVKGLKSMSGKFLK